VERRGLPQERILRRVYSADLDTLHAAILKGFAGPRTSPFQGMRAIELKLPDYPADWLLTLADRGGFLEPYKQLPAADRDRDLLLEEPTFDRYWQSEYTTAGGSVLFRCGFILHFAAQGSSRTEIQMYEKTPTIWTGERWDFLRHGIGIGKVHDIRFVEPTVKDRHDMLDVIEGVLGRR
jgi:hypothetical protein